MAATLTTTGRVVTRPPPRRPLTHFLCLQVVNPSSRQQLERSLASFRDDVCSKGTSDLTFLSEAIRPLGSIHLTLGVMSLTPDSLKATLELLPQVAAPQHHQSSVTGGHETTNQLISGLAGSVPPSSPITISLQGIHAMRSRHSTSVLYAEPVDLTNRLYSTASQFRTTFIETELLVPENRPLKLHATLVNTRNLKRRAEQSGLISQTGQTVSVEQRKRKHRDRRGVTLDATALVERYRDHVWARDVVVDRLAICEMGARDVLDEQGEVVDAEYKVVGEVRFCPPLLP